jgi:hypothetical protein
MAYQTGTATSQHDLLQQLAAWLVLQGWTLDHSQADGSDWRVHMHKDGHYLHLRTRPIGNPFDGQNYNSCNIPTLCCYLSTAYAGIGSAWYASLTGAPLGTDGKVCGAGITVNTGANVAFYFFHDGSDHYTIVVERNAGLFQVMGFGLALTKHGGNWTGGPYIHGHLAGGNTANTPLNANSRCPFYYGTDEYGVSNGAFVRVDVDTFTGNWVSIGPSDAARQGWTGRRGYSTVRGQNDLPAKIPHTHALSGYLVSSINSQAVLLPIRIFAERDEGGPCLIGTAPAVFQTNAVGNGYLAGTEIQLGADTYKLFPGFAVKKVL